MQVWGTLWEQKAKPRASQFLRIVYAKRDAKLSLSLLWPVPLTGRITRVHNTPAVRDDADSHANKRRTNDKICQENSLQMLENKSQVTQFVNKITHFGITKVTVTTENKALSGLAQNCKCNCRPRKQDRRLANGYTGLTQVSILES